ncbi:MAG: patatin-like phospholipase family protein [Victivallaceae bacterium]|nr:patatin-like phospholipase family protein [Victivallaceae bacterium]
MLNFLNDGYGVVFAGGGAKGAWQIGAWKAFAERQLPPAGIISGTSVGALNAALYSQYAFESDGIRIAESIWKNLTTELILTGMDSTKIPAFLRIPQASATVAGCSSKAVYAILKQIIPMFLYPIPPKNFWVDQLYVLNNNHGIFTHDGLKKLLDDGLQKESSSYKIPTIICAHNKHRGEVDYSNIVSFDLDEKKKYLLASTAIPFIFPNVQIHDQLYCDGGFGVDAPLYFEAHHNAVLDNMPIAPLSSSAFNPQKIKTVITFALNPDEPFSFSDPRYCNLDIYPIIPSENLGNPLDFSPESIRNRMDLGYQDAKKWLETAIANSRQTRQLQFSEVEYHRQQALLRELNEKREMLSQVYQQFINVERQEREELSESQQARETYVGKHPDIHIGTNKPFLLPEEFSANDDDICKQSRDFIEDACNASKKRIQLVRYEEIFGNLPKIPLWKRLFSLKARKSALQRENIFSQNIRSIGFLVNALMKGLNLFSAKLNRTQRDLIKSLIASCNTEFQNTINIINITRQGGRERCLFGKNDGKKLGFTNFQRCSSRFVGRQKELQKLREIILSSNDIIPVIWGEPGIGKTSLIYKLAETCQDDFPGGRFFIPSENCRSIPDAVNTLLNDPKVLQFFNLSENDKSLDCEANFQLIKQRLLALGKPVLLFFDNVSDPAMLRDAFQYFSDGGNERIRLIASSRCGIVSNGVGDYLQLFPLSGMGKEDALALLGVQDTTDETERHYAEKIYSLLQGNVLAMSLVCNMISNFPPFQKDKYKQVHNTLMKKPQQAELFSLGTLVKSTLENLSPQAMRFAEFAALCPPDYIPLTWIRKMMNLNDENDFQNIIFELWKYCVLDPDADLEYARIHRIVRAGIQSGNAEHRRFNAIEFSNFIAREIQTKGINTKETMVFSDMMFDWQQNDLQGHTLSVFFSLNLYHDLLYYITVYQFVESAEKVFQNMGSVIASVENPILRKKYDASFQIFSGFVQKSQNNFPKAVSCFQQAINLRKEIFGNLSVLTALPISYLASVYNNMGNQEEAARCFQEAYKIFQAERPYKLQDPDSCVEFEAMAIFYIQYADFLFTTHHIPEAEKSLRTATAYAAWGAYWGRPSKTAIASSLLLGNCTYHLGVYYKKRNVCLSFEDRWLARHYFTWSKRIFQLLSTADHPHENIGKIEQLLAELQ